MSEARIWYSRDPDQQNLPGDCQNLIVLTEEFYQEILEHPIPTDLDAAKALSSSPAALDLFTWLSYRCFVAKGEERISLFGEFGLANQLGVRDSRPRRFRERLEQWLTLVRAMWPECPARISPDGHYLLVNRASALISRGGEMPALNQATNPAGQRIPLSTIDAAVAARLGPGRVSGNAQPAVFSRQVGMYLAKDGRLEHDSDRQISTTVATIRPSAMPSAALRCYGKSIRMSTIC